MIRRPLLLRLAALVVCTALTGCAAPGSTPDSTPAAESTPSAIATPDAAEPTPSAPVEDPNDPTTWIVSGAGIGPVQLGAEIAGYAEVGPYAEDDTDCSNPAVLDLVGDGMAPLRLVAVDGGSAVASVHVTTWGADAAVPSPSTSHGIRLGSSVADVQAVHPGAELTDEYNGTVQYAEADAGGWVIFTMQDDAVVQLSASTTPTNPSEYCG